MPDVKRVDDAQSGVTQAYNYAHQLLKVFPEDIDARVGTFAFTIALALQIVDEETGEADPDHKQWILDALDHSIEMLSDAIKREKGGEK